MSRRPSRKPPPPRVVLLVGGSAPFAPDETVVPLGALDGLKTEIAALELPYAARQALLSTPMHRLLQSVDGKRLTYLRARAQERRRQDGPALPVLSNFFLVNTPDPALAAGLTYALRRLKQVDQAWIAPELGPLPTACLGVSLPTLDAAQGHLLARPVGVGAVPVWTLPGGQGEGVGAVVVERGWNLVNDEVTHCDLPAGIRRVWGPATGASAAERSHGMSSLGLIAALHDGPSGGRGVAAAAAPVSVASTLPGDATFTATALDPEALGAADEAARPELYNALASAIDALVGELGAASGPVPGVILVEEQALITAADAGVAGSGDPDERFNAPVVVDPAIAALITLATGLGVAVVLPAGNGGLDLGGVRDALGAPIADPTPAGQAPRTRCGALLVGAVDGHRPLLNSNRGAGVLLHAQGLSVGSCAYVESPDLVPTQALTSQFNGTSAASAIAAGAVIALRGLARARTGGALEVDALRDLLFRTGQAAFDAGSLAPLTDVVGVMPDLAQAAVALGAAPQLRMRDQLGDSGQPHTDPVGDSLDLWARATVMSSATRPLYEGGGTRVDLRPSASLRRGRTAHLYARVANTSGALADVTVDVSWADVATAEDPATWIPLGSLSRAGVPPDGEPYLLGPLDWDVPSDLPPSQVVLIAAASTVDFGPVRPDGGLTSYVWDHGSVTAREVTVSGP